jgi:conjugal transfer pilus assembly protein TraE
MQATEHKNTLETLKASVRFQRYALTALGVILALNVLQIMRMYGHERIVVTPPVIHKTFWVEHDKASAEYLEMMANFVAHYVLDVTPENVEYNQAIVLKLVRPDLEPELKTRMRNDAARLRRDNATTLFFPKALQVFEARQAVHVQGNLDTYVNDRKVSTRLTNYLAEFDFAGGRIYLKSFKETDADPFHQSVTYRAAAPAAETTEGVTDATETKAAQPAAQPAAQ